MGTHGMGEFSRGGVINTDNNLYLEFSAPFSIGNPSVMKTNVNAIVQYRESILPYLVTPIDRKERARQEKKWATHPEAIEMTSQALGLFLNGQSKTLEFSRLMEKLDRQYPQFAPARFLKNETMTALRREPKLLQKVALILLNEKGAKIRVDISAVLVPVSEERVSVVFVDNDARVIYGELYFSGLKKEEAIQQFVNEVMVSIRTAYHHDAMDALQQGDRFPLAALTLRRIKELITTKVKEKTSPGQKSS
jgi:spermidine synthase